MILFCTNIFNFYCALSSLGKVSEPLKHLPAVSYLGSFVFVICSHTWKLVSLMYCMVPESVLNVHVGVIGGLCWGIYTFFTGPVKEIHVGLGLDLKNSRIINQWQVLDIYVVYVTAWNLSMCLHGEQLAIPVSITGITAWVTRWRIFPSLFPAYETLRNL